jgi:hypothetical protein
VLVHKGEQQIQQELKKRTLVATAVTREHLIVELKETANIHPEFEPVLKTFEEQAILKKAEAVHYCISNQITNSPYALGDSIPNII